MPRAEGELDSFGGKIAVVTGAGSGIGRALAQNLAARGCHLGICDVSQQALQETASLCRQHPRATSTRIVACIADVSNRTAVHQFQANVAAELETTFIDLLINNAGIAGGASFVTSSPDEWEKTFDVCWGGVYFTTRAFFPMLQAATKSHIVNLSSVNGMWAALLPGRPSSAYSAAKFAVRGFTEGLILDLRLNAPHVHCHLVMPGYVGTQILANTERVLDSLVASDTPRRRKRVLDWIGILGGSAPEADDEALAATVDRLNQQYAMHAPLSPTSAAELILQGVEAGRWRILIGDDAKVMDEMVRAEPETAYSSSFIQRMELKTRAASR